MCALCVTEMNSEPFCHAISLCYVMYGYMAMGIQYNDCMTFISIKRDLCLRRLDGANVETMVRGEVREGL